MTDFKKILDLMWDYQKAHAITQRCMTNTQFALDCIKTNYPGVNPKAVAVFVSHTDYVKQATVVVVHLVIQIGENKLIDPSYETHSVANPHYCNNFNIFWEGFKVLPDAEKHKKWFLEKFIGLAKVAERMNKGELCVYDADYYQKQADYVQEMMGKRGALMVT